MPDFDPFAYFVGDQYGRNNANYNNLMGYTNQASQYDPFASGGGFGNQTAYYAGQGASYGRATGGFNAPGIPGGGGYDPGMPIYGGGGIGSDAARAPDQPGNNPGQMPYSGGGGWDVFNPQTYAPSAQPNIGSGVATASGGSMPVYGGGSYGGSPAVDWDKYFTQLTPNYSPQPAAGQSQTTGYDYNNPATYGGGGGWGAAPAMPDANRLLGYTPGQLYSGGGIGSDALRDTYAQEIAKSGMPIYGGGGASVPTQSSQPFNPYGSSGDWGIGGFGMPGGVTGGGGYFGGKGTGSMGSGASTDIYGNPTRSGDAPLYPSGMPGMPVFQPTS